ncbi:MAG: YggT family protein [Caldilinea sp.]|nr:YggT family protein [Caldilinea sp.]MCB0134992.1 YggT family protein [Caldilineaceae bacterium]MCB0053727.1 YggT family protein [Caldilinea sp.]MCB0148500.1 YggT family protein [Caldilineaceae bacterium]MCB9116557.1 YggT family protein [Caldilineaceae bacterium]
MSAFFEILAMLLQVYSYVLLARALMSWIPNLDPYNPIVQFLYQITEPVLEPVRRLIPPLGGMIDISIIVVFFALIILQQMLMTIAAS